MLKLIGADKTRRSLDGDDDFCGNYGGSVGGSSVIADWTKLTGAGSKLEWLTRIERRPAEPCDHHWLSWARTGDLARWKTIGTLFRATGR
ncbi:MAG: hypothetical protein JNL18_16110 [Planctomycetaceae bacterium]|nr:hypothetical protein [Planctomycetaceae bacterium]